MRCDVAYVSGGGIRVPRCVGVVVDLVARYVGLGVGVPDKGDGSGTGLDSDVLWW